MRWRAADKLAEEGIEAEVIDLRTIRPMDIADRHREREEDQSLRHGRGGLPAILGDVRDRRADHDHAFDYLDAPVARVAGKDVPMPYAANLEKLALPNVDEVVEAAKAVLYV